MIRIETVENRTQLREFVRFPLSIYSGGSPWVPPVWRDEMMRLDRARSPFFKHSDAALFLARDADGEPVHDAPIVPDEADLPIDPSSDPAPGYDEAQRGKPGGFIGEEVGVFLHVRPTARAVGDHGDLAGLFEGEDRLLGECSCLFELSVVGV